MKNVDAIDISKKGPAVGYLSAIALAPRSEPRPLPVLIRGNNPLPPCPPRLARIFREMGDSHRVWYIREANKTSFLDAPPKTPEQLALEKWQPEKKPPLDREHSSGKSAEKGKLSTNQPASPMPLNGTAQKPAEHIVPIAALPAGPEQIVVRPNPGEVAQIQISGLPRNPLPLQNPAPPLVLFKDPKKNLFSNGWMQGACAVGILALLYSVYKVIYKTEQGAAQKKEQISEPLAVAV